MWKTVKLKEICKVFNDGDWIETKHQSKDGLRLIQTGNVKSGSFSNRIDKARYISEDTFASLNCTEIFPEDILVSRLPKPVGRACIIPALDERAITAVDCTIIRVKKEEVIPEFLNYYMQSPSYFVSVQKEVTGATRQRISRKKLGEIPVILPPLPEQQRIVAKLDAAFAEIDKAITLADKKEAEIEKFKSSLLTNQLSTSSNQENTSNWKTVKFDELVLSKGTGMERKASLQSADKNFPYLKMNNITKDNRLNLSTIVKVDANNEEIENYKLEKNDFLFNTRNSVELVGKSAIFEDDKLVLFNNNILRVKFNSLVNAKYVNYFFTSFSGKKQLNRVKSGTTNVAAIYYKDLKNIEISLPPLPEQQRIVAKLDDAFSKLKIAKQSIEKMKSNYSALKSALLAQELQSEVA